MSEIEGKKADRRPRRVQLVRAFTKAGVTSRTQARQMILDGRVTVNGRIVKHILEYVDLIKDDIRLDGVKIEPVRQYTYLLLHKPAGMVTTRRDPQGRPTVYSFLPELNRWVFPVGRLDMDSEGLLLLTDDGGLSDFLTDPRSEVPKRYLVLIDRKMNSVDLRRLEQGVRIDRFVTKPCRIKHVGPEEPGYWMSVTVTEGKNRQVRRMMEAAGYRVLRLVRTHIGPLALGNLPVGGFRTLSEKELKALSALRHSRLK